MGIGLFLKAIPSQLVGLKLEPPIGGVKMKISSRRPLRLWATFGLVVWLLISGPTFAKKDDGPRPGRIPIFDLSEATYGFEFEFSSPELLYGIWVPTRKLLPHDSEALFDGREPKDAKRMAEYVRKLCGASGDCQVRKTSKKYKNGEYKVIFNDGYWIRISFDPGVVEVQGKPITKKEYSAKRDLLQKYIFDAALAPEVNLVIDRSEGIGHFNAGAFSAFGRDEFGGNRLMSYFVDGQNNPELFLGAIGQDVGANSPPLSILKASQRKALYDLTQTRAQHPYPIEEVGADLNRLVYTHTTDTLSEPPNSDQALNEHYQVFGLRGFEELDRRFKKDLPLELRSIFTQESIDQFILMIDLFELRNKYLAENNYPVTYDTKRGRRTYSDQELVNRFFEYVIEAGGDYDHFRPLLHWTLRDLKPRVPKSFRVRFCRLLL